MTSKVFNKMDLWPHQRRAVKAMCSYIDKYKKGKTFDISKVKEENVVVMTIQMLFKYLCSGVSKWTKRFAGSWDHIWDTPFDNLAEARKFENLLKRQKGGAGFYKLTKLNKANYSPSS